jgi:outer membrane protease
MNEVCKAEMNLKNTFDMNQSRSYKGKNKYEISQAISKGFIQFSRYKWTAVCGQITLPFRLIGYSCRPQYTT